MPDSLHTLPAPFPRLLCRDGLAALRVGVPRPSFTGPRRVAREGHSHRGVRVGLEGAAGGRVVSAGEGRPGAWRGASALLTDIGRAC